MEVLAWQVLQLSVPAIVLSAFLLLTLGFTIAYLWLGDQVAPMARIPYFLITAASMLAVSAANYLFVYIPEAVHGGRLSAIVGVTILNYVLIGAILGWAAMARAKSYSGGVGKAWFSLVPFLNLVLVFSRPLGEPEPRRPGTMIVHVFLVCVGLLIYGISRGLDNNLESAVAEHAQEAVQDRGVALSIVNLRLAAGELPTVLAETAASVATERLDEVTVLTGAKVSGTTITYFYTLDAGAEMPGPDIRPYLADAACAEVGSMQLLKAGATFGFHYESKTGGAPSHHDITLADCEAA